MKYKERRLTRPLCKGEIKAAAVRAEARAVRTRSTDDPPNSNATKPK